MDIRSLLTAFKNGEISLDEAYESVASTRFEELGYAKIDSDRKKRTGFPETVFCQGKINEHLKAIYQKIYELEGEVLGTRASESQYNFLKAFFPEIRYNPISRILKLEAKNKKRSGLAAVCSAGSADVGVAEEAAETAEFFGCCVERIYDVGVSGIHRLFSKLEVIRRADCIIAVAGMEGALAGIIGGLVARPVIAVPTSIGYGANFNGLSSLLTMLNSCASGVAVVNVDYGYGAGFLAAQITRLGDKI